MEKTRKGQQGLSLMEALVAMLIGKHRACRRRNLVIKALQITDLVTVRAEMQQDGRAAINSILKDLSLSGTGMPVGGVQLPTGHGGHSFTLCLFGRSVLPEEPHLPGKPHVSRAA